MDFHETSSPILEERRDRYKDIKCIDGTQTHYHFYFPSTDEVDIRYVACLCDPCRKEDWANCVNVPYVGRWQRIQIQDVSGASDREHSTNRVRRADNLADSLTGEETAVALFTSEGESRGECMWLMKPKERPFCVAPNSAHICPKSGEKFGPGERVLKGEYYKRLSHNVYEFRPDLGVFSVPARMLRAGGPTDPVVLERKTGFGGHPTDRQLYDLSACSAERIQDLITNVFKDKGAP